MQAKNIEKEKSKQRILKTATKLFAKNGYDGVGIREICKEAKANICMISYFWGGKEGLYQGILDDLIERQLEYTKTFLNLEVDPRKLPKEKQIELLLTLLNKAIEALYSDFISEDLIMFLLQEQQRQKIELSSPIIIYLRKLIASILNKGEKSKEVILKSVFIMSQIISPRIMPAFTLKLLKQNKFTTKDINIIKKNVKTYVLTLINEEKK